MSEQADMGLAVERTLRCFWCEERKPLGAFIKNASKKHGVNYSRCRECELKARKARAGSIHVKEKRCTLCKEVKPASEFTENKSTLDSLSSWCRDCERWRTLKRAYGITKQAYEQLLLTQGGLCAICRKPSASALHVDHVHSTGKIRGLLCGNCNRAIGLFQDDIQAIKCAARYLESHR